MFPFDEEEKEDKYLALLNETWPTDFQIDSRISVVELHQVGVEMLLDECMKPKAERKRMPLKHAIPQVCSLPPFSIFLV
jgi:hypothetical protein